MKPLRNTAPYSGSGCGVGGLLFGLVFIGMGISFFASFGHLLFSKSFSQFATFMPGALIALLFGILLVWGGISSINTQSRMRDRKVGIFPDIPRAGQDFTFVYEADIRRTTDVKWVGVFFVYRERVTLPGTGDNSEVHDLDRLIHPVVRAGRTYQGGETLREEHRFVVPPSALGLRNCYHTQPKARLETSWLVKVRINLGKNNDIWREYPLEIVSATDLPVNSTGSASNTESDSSASENRYDVFLLDSGAPQLSLQRLQTFHDLLPQMRGDQCKDIVRLRSHHSPHLLMESVTMREAEEMQRRVHEIGGTTETRPALLALPEVKERSAIFSLNALEPFSK